MATKRPPEATIAAHYPNIQADDYLLWLVVQPTYDLDQAKYIRHWYKYQFSNLEERYLSWMNHFRLGNSEEKMKLLLGEETEEYSEWIYSLRSKRKSCIEYWEKRYGVDKGLEQYRLYQKSVNSTNVEKRVDGWKETFSNKSDEEMKRINSLKGVTLESTIQRYGEEEGNLRWKAICERRSHNTIEYFMNLGYDKETATRMNEDFRKNQSRTSPYSLEYCTLQYPNDPELALKSHIDKCASREHFSLENCIKKYGDEEGRSIWQKRQDAWLDAFYDRSDEEMADIIKRRTSPGHSKSSQDFFRKLMNIFPGLSYQIGTEGGELCLKVEVRKWYLYDFYCPDLNLIIEYHGRYYHSTPEDEEKDELKRQFALDRGYNFLHVYDDQPDAYDHCIKGIKELLNEQN